MKIAKQNIKPRINVPGAIARQELNFGDATGYGLIAGEYFSLKQGNGYRAAAQRIGIRSLPVTALGVYD